MALAGPVAKADDRVMTTTVSAPTVVIGARRAIANELRALAAVVSAAPWPPWYDPQFGHGMARLRLTIDEQLERSEADIPGMAARLGLDFETLERAAADPALVRRGVTILTGSEAETPENANVMAVLLSTYLFVDQLVYIGMLARAVGPSEQAVANS